MNRARKAGWRAILAIVVALAGGHAQGGEVTVVGSLWQGEPAAKPKGLTLFRGAPPESPVVTARPAAEDATVSAAYVSDVEGGASIDPREAGQGPALGGGPLQQMEAVPSPADDQFSPLQGPPRVFTLVQRPLETSWYTRFDYACWKEEANGSDSLDEHGTLFTLGYARRNRVRRLRVELFSGNMISGPGALWHGSPMNTTTRHLGARGEFELLWDVNVGGWPVVTAFAGFGTRFWIRDIKDGPLSDPDNFLVGHEEDWVTLYPYLGLERSWLGPAGDEIFVSGRVGSTVWTYQSASTVGGPSLNPGACVTGQVELGLRHECVFISAYFEAMTWSESPEVSGIRQPTSQLYTTGLKLGLRY